MSMSDQQNILKVIQTQNTQMSQENMEMKRAMQQYMDKLINY
jgi:hypothetical protein